MLTWCHRRRLNETDKALSVAYHSRVHPVSNWNLWACVWIAGVNITLLVMGGSCGSWKCSQDSSSKECRCKIDLHGEKDCDGHETSRLMCNRKLGKKDRTEVGSHFDTDLAPRTRRARGSFWKAHGGL